jgi:integrase
VPHPRWQGAAGDPLHGGVIVVADPYPGDQIGSEADPHTPREINLAWAEMYRIMAGPFGKLTDNDIARLANDGWSRERCEYLARLFAAHSNGVGVSHRQIDAYVEHFDITPTEENLHRVTNVILSARAQACHKANESLGLFPGDLSGWADAAAESDEPFIYDRLAAAKKAEKDDKPREAEPTPAPPPPPQAAAQPAPAPLPKLLLREAAKTCIAEYKKNNAWSPASIAQVETAIRVFDFACGGNVAIEDLNQSHVSAFHDLCAKLPNRWGKTRAERQHGLPASLAYAEQLHAEGQSTRVGISSKTIEKYITWISVVLKYAADEYGGKTPHTPAKTLNFRTQSFKIVQRGEGKSKRARDKRANWQLDEIEHLLSAPIWHGCLSLDERFKQGHQIYHDAWYWIPLILILTGARSAEIVGMREGDVKIDAPIPYFDITSNEDRGLKTAQSTRKIPIHPELIRLGFIDYVRSIRSMKHTLLFPEMDSPNSQSFSTTFRKSIFNEWREWAFPQGTSQKRIDRGQVKDKDVHSIRGFFTSQLQSTMQQSVINDLVGHEGESLTEKVYSDPTILQMMLEAIAILTPITRNIQVRPLHMRPPSRLRFGKQRGRRRGI